MQIQILDGKNINEPIVVDTDGKGEALLKTIFGEEKLKKVEDENIFADDDTLEEKRFIVNAQKISKYKEKMYNGRKHYVADMLAIVGNTVMNDIYYPEKLVAEKMSELENLVATYDHPKINGQFSKPTDPRAINTYYVGGFVKAPKKVDKKIYAEHWLDVEFAGGLKRGRELMRNIETASEKIGVSTGGDVWIKKQSGVGEDGKPYKYIAKNLTFDHVAILPPKEQAAGDHVGTRLMINNQNKGEKMKVEGHEKLITLEDAISFIQEQGHRVLMKNSQEEKLFNEFSEGCKDFEAWKAQAKQEKEALQTELFEVYADNKEDTEILSVSTIKSLLETYRKITEQAKDSPLRVGNASIKSKAKATEEVSTDYIKNIFDTRGA